ncbi:MAG: hypothetical protein M9916_03410 [Crocinitomicaceae bacterium]|nr:hypothetical protein [Crocinitomicaceae bacterium]
MNKYGQHIKNGLFLLVIALLFTPLIQEKFKVFKVVPLNGVAEAIDDPFITKQTWFSGKYQEAQERYVKRNYGLREPLVRIYNQWNYTFYKKSAVSWLEIGSDNYLYETNYIKAALGLDYMGEERILEQTKQLKRIADTLQKHHVDLIVLLAPGKGSFYSDNFPSYYKGIKKGKTNSEDFRKCFQQEGIHFFDANAWFLELKKRGDTNKLFSKTGIHWSKYGEYIVADSLLKYLRAVTQKPFPSIQLDKMDYSEQLRSTDNDIWKGMDIYSNIPDFKMAYPQTHRTNVTLNQTKVVTIADSYYWGMYKAGLSQDYFNNGEFWYYFHERYLHPEKKPLLLSEIDFKKELLKNDVVLLICTDANLPHFGFGLLEQFK